MRPVLPSAARRLAIALVGIAAAAAPAAAVDLVVTRYDDPAPDGCDPGDCSLREAVIEANSDAAADRVLLSAGSYRLTRVGTAESLAQDGDLDVTGDLEIVGTGAGMTRISSTGTGENTLTADDLSLQLTLRKMTIQGSDVNGVVIAVGRVIIEDCEFRDNGFHGVVIDAGTLALVRRSTSTGNAQDGLFFSQANATVENCTLSGNGGRELSVSLAGQFSCTHCTIADATDSGSELHVQTSTADIANSVVVGDCSFVFGAINSLGGNVESTGDTCQFDALGDHVGVTNTALRLGALADNGGGTRTHLPQAASVLSGAAVDALSLAEDQRGVPRTTSRESGAVERTSAEVASPIFVDGFEQGSVGAWTNLP